jgi:type I restriction enzyme S subunit
MRETLVKSEEFKDSPLGKIPKDWNYLTINDCLRDGLIVDVQDGNHGEAHPKTDDFVSEGIPFVMAKDLVNGQIHIADCHKITWHQYQSLRVGFARPGDVLLSHKGTIGLTAIVPDWLQHVMLTPQVTYYRVSEGKKLSGKFLFWFFQSPLFQQRLEVLSAQSTRSYIGITLQKTLSILVPPFDEQKRIAELLDTVDEAIAHTSSLIAKLKQMKAGLLHDLLTQGLDENGELRNAIAHPEQFKDSPLGRIPKDWKVSSVECEFDITTGFTLGEHRRPRRNKRKYLRVANVQREEIVLDDIAELEAEDREFSTRLLEKDDLLIVEGHANPDEIGRCAIVPVEAVGLTFQNHLFRLRSRQLVPKFALAWLNSEWVRAYWRCLCGTSSGLNTINRTILNAIPVPVPDKEEQRRIIAVINTQKTRICTEEAYRDKLKLQKQGLMHDLLTGKVRIRNA